jgi:hypothetical protein
LAIKTLQHRLIFEFLISDFAFHQNFARDKKRLVLIFELFGVYFVQKKR